MINDYYKEYIQQCKDFFIPKVDETWWVSIDKESPFCVMVRITFVGAAIVGIQMEDGKPVGIFKNKVEFVEKIC